MPNFILSIISSHLLTMIEKELIDAEPAIVKMIEQEITLLINKLESFLSEKVPAVAKVINPELEKADALFGVAIEAGAKAITKDM